MILGIMIYPHPDSNVQDTHGLIGRDGGGGGPRPGSAGGDGLAGGGGGLTLEAGGGGGVTDEAGGGGGVATFVFDGGGGGADPAGGAGGSAESLEYTQYCAAYWMLIVPGCCPAQVAGATPPAVFSR
jgi:hypothetical protein